MRWRGGGDTVVMLSSTSSLFSESVYFEQVQEEWANLWHSFIHSFISMKKIEQSEVMGILGAGTVKTGLSGTTWQHRTHNF